ncbi:hypothetical protein ATANTOWER_014951 [Ataeniobius toweri]|uniref:Uncharacterized protein n=1 Tax=Ataeniobius toweri TaxID=208326 RepID=A0ABU7B8Z9_9TELE|nr:hypothetical protein [Ataeniobius toweri]
MTHPVSFTKPNVGKTMKMHLTGQLLYNVSDAEFVKSCISCTQFCLVSRLLSCAGRRGKKLHEDVALCLSCVDVSLITQVQWLDSSVMSQEHQQTCRLLS